MIRKLLIKGNRAFGKVLLLSRHEIRSVELFIRDKRIYEFREL